MQPDARIRRNTQAHPDAARQRPAGRPHGVAEPALAKVELPKVNNRRLDLLGERPDGELFGIEFQSRNERHFPFRMGAYLFGAAEQRGRLPRQIVLSVGEARCG